MKRPPCDKGCPFCLGDRRGGRAPTPVSSKTSPVLQMRQPGRAKCPDLEDSQHEMCRAAQGLIKLSAAQKSVGAKKSSFAVQSDGKFICAAPEKLKYVARLYFGKMLTDSHVRLIGQNSLNRKEPFQEILEHFAI